VARATTFPRACQRALDGESTGPGWATSVNMLAHWESDILLNETWGSLWKMLITTGTLGMIRHWATDSGRRLRRISGGVVIHFSQSQMG